MCSTFRWVFEVAPGAHRDAPKYVEGVLSAKDKKLVLDNVTLAVARGTIEGFLKPFAINKEKTKSEGVKFHAAGPGFKKLMDEFLAKELETIPAVMTRQGATNAQRIVSTILEKTKKWQRLSREKIKGDVDLPTPRRSRRRYTTK